jgi:hypothetical protein
MFGSCKRHYAVATHDNCQQYLWLQYVSNDYLIIEICNIFKWRGAIFTIFIKSQLSDGS